MPGRGDRFPNPVENVVAVGFEDNLETSGSNPCQEAPELRLPFRMKMALGVLY